MFLIALFVVLVLFMGWYYVNSDKVHDYFEKEETLIKGPLPTLHELNNRSTNRPTLKALQGGFWDRDHPDWLIKGKKYYPKD